MQKIKYLLIIILLAKCAVAESQTLSLITRLINSYGISLWGYIS